MAKASSPLPLEINQRGDSGTNHMKVICRMLGANCKQEGIRQLQLDVIAKVPRVTPAATIAPRYSVSNKYPEESQNDSPTNQEALNKDPRTARSFGWDNSGRSNMSKWGFSRAKNKLTSNQRRCSNDSKRDSKAQEKASNNEHRHLFA